MSTKTEVPITNQKTLRAVYETYGVARALEALKKYSDCKAPGFALALAAVEAECANARAELSGEVLRETARAGHDIGRSLAVYTCFKKGKPVIEVEMPDLGDEEP